jgi:hypothetical protein
MHEAGTVSVTYHFERTYGSKGKPQDGKPFTHGEVTYRCPTCGQHGSGASAHLEGLPRWVKERMT